MPLSKFRLYLALPTAALLVASQPIFAQDLQRRPAPEPQAAQRPAPLPAQPVLPVGTSLNVEITRPYPTRLSETIEGRLLHPIYANGVLAVPEYTPVHGTIVALDPDTRARWHARLRGDFTPFHTVRVRFDALLLPNGVLNFAADEATNGAPVVRLSASGAKPSQSLVARYWARGKDQLHDRIAWCTAPGFRDRATQMLYRQLPLHPERLDSGTGWSFELAEPLAVPAWPQEQPPSEARNAPSPSNPETWSVHALLSTAVSSATARPGDPVLAEVVEPVYDRDRVLVVPQGATLLGKVTIAKPARSLGRNGRLRFTFQQVNFPAGKAQPVEGNLNGATTEQTQNLSLDAEGTISPRSQASALAPLLLTVLAGRALDEDGNFTADTGVASNGFGLVGRIVGLAAGSRNLAAGIGYYAAGLSFYENFLRPGHDVVFAKDTRIEIETSPLRAPVIKPANQ